VLTASQGESATVCRALCDGLFRTQEMLVLVMQVKCLIDYVIMSIYRESGVFQSGGGGGGSGAGGGGGAGGGSGGGDARCPASEFEELRFLQALQQP